MCVCSAPIYVCAVCFQVQITGDPGIASEVVTASMLVVMFDSFQLMIHPKFSV